MKYWNKKFLSILLSILLTATPCSLLTACGDGKGETVKLNFSQKDGSIPQNLKKVDMFNPTWTFMGQADGTFDPAALDTLTGVNALKADNFRIDMMFGNEQNGIGKPIGRGGLTGVSADEWSLASQFLKKCKDNKISPYLVMVGTPSYATKPGDDLDFRNVPDLKRYYEFCYNTADYLKRSGVYAILETWNEPDLEGNVYWLGSQQEWIDTVVTGTRAYYAANPFSTVISAGIARPLAFIRETDSLAGIQQTGWQYFWESYEKARAIPDGFSWHYYGPSDGDLEGDYINEGGTGNFNYQLNVVREALNAYQNGTAPELNGKKYDLRRVQQHLTEFHPVSNDFNGGKSMPNDTYEQVWAFFDSILRINEASDITRVSWPMWLSSGQFGLFETDYAVNPVYHALWSYARLPVDRVPASAENEAVGLIAGADSQRAGVIAYNRSLKKAQTVTIDWSDLPFEAQSCTVYRIDPAYYQKRLSDKTPEIVKVVENPGNKGKETLRIPVKGAYYIEFNSLAQGAETDNTADVGTLVKKRYYYTERGDGKPYADIFNESMNAYVGMLEEDTGEAGVSAILSGLGTRETLTFRYETWGEPQESSSSALGVRVDYHTQNGFAKSVYLPVGGRTYNMTVPFGTEKAADECLPMGDGASGTYIFELKKNAPEDWDGMVEVSYLIRNAGKGATAKFFIS